MRYHIKLVFTLLVCLPSICFSSEKLIFALDLIRHGDRTPVKAISTVDYQWKEGIGQLTATGMRQEYELGQSFRARYVEATHLLPAHYEHGTIYACSTDYDRTLMSAQSLLMGLYPPGTGPSLDKQGLPHAVQPIPVHSAPRDLDQVITHDIDYAEREALMKKYVYALPAWQQKENALKPSFPRWSALTGFNLKSLDDLGVLANTLFIHRLYQAPMPVGLSEEDIETITDAGNWADMVEENTLPLAKAYSQQVVTNIGKFLQKGSKQGARLKYVLLSAHDSTIASTMSVLGVPLASQPHYASDLNFSLYENGANHYTVKVTYNGAAVTLPACGGTVCSLQKFLALTQQAETDVDG